jgi:small subunit ribosomal protein S18e
MSSLIYEKVAEFKHILRVFNTNLDGRRKVPFALRTIRGIGRRFAFLVCKKAKIDPNRRAGDLNEQEAQKVIDIINDPVGNGFPIWFLNRQRDFRDGTHMQMASNTLDTKLRDDLERMKKVRQNRGLRHFWGLKCRGQHSKSTGRRGATVGVVRKKR